MPLLDWVNKAQATTAASEVPYHLLDFRSAHGAPSAENLLIQGDNLVALKALVPLYRRSIRCVYIDPPYNTQSAFEHYDDKLEHSQWLSMMYPRLTVLRDLLNENGSIWVSIDDGEAHYLKVLMDDVFGRTGFVTSIVWQQRTTRENRKAFSANHEYLLVYAKDRRRFEASRNALDLDDEVRGRYKNPDNDPRGPWQSVSANAQAGHGTPSQFYSLVAPNGKRHQLPNGRCWLYTEPRMREEIARGNIWFGRDGNGVPRVKKFLSAATQSLTPETLWLATDVGTNDFAKKHLVELFADAPLFETPKPESLIARVLHIATSPGDLVLDSFLGSGTTAAVAHKMSRRWIGIEVGDHAVTHCIPRMEKVIGGEQGGISAAVGWKGGGGFRFYTLGEPVFDAAGTIHPAVTFAGLAAFVWHFETGLASFDDAQDERGRGAQDEPGGNAQDERRGSAQDVRGDSAQAQREGNNASARRGGASPYLGTHDGVAYYLLYNGILGDKRPNGGNVLTAAVLDHLDSLGRHVGPRVIYGEATRLGPARLKDLGITFKQIPYDLKVR